MDYPSISPKIILYSSNLVETFANIFPNKMLFSEGSLVFPSPVSASGLLDGQVVQVTEDDCHEGDGYHLPGKGVFFTKPSEKYYKVGPGCSY